MFRLRNRFSKKLVILVKLPSVKPEGRYVLKGKFKENLVTVYGPCFEDELQIWRKLRQIGCPLPWISTQWTLGPDKVLVMEVNNIFKPIPDYRVALYELLEQLSFLHGFMIHGNINSKNICSIKRLNGNHHYFQLILPNQLQNNVFNRRKDLRDLILTVIPDVKEQEALIKHFDSIKENELEPPNYLPIFNQF